MLALGERGELEPVEAMAWQGQQICKFADWGKSDPAHALDRGYPLEPAQIQFDGLRKPGQVIDAKYGVSLFGAFRNGSGLVLTHECKHTWVGRVQLFILT